MLLISDLEELEEAYWHEYQRTRALFRQTPEGRYYFQCQEAWLDARRRLRVAKAEAEDEGGIAFFRVEEGQ